MKRPDVRPAADAYAARPGGARALRRLAPLACLAALVVPTGVTQAGEQDVRALVTAAQEAQQAVLRVQWHDRRAPAAGSVRQGVVVDPDGWVLVAGPPPERSDALRYFVTVDGPAAVEARLRGVDAETGLTLLRVPRVGLKPLPAFDTRPAADAVGRDIATVAADGGVAIGQVRAAQRHSFARVVLRAEAGHLAVVTSRPTTGLLEATLVAGPDPVGSPWLDAQGRVVGLQYGQRDHRPSGASRGVHLAVPAATARIVWPLLRDHGAVPRAGLGIRTKVLEEPLRRHLCPDCAGYRILGVEAGGAGARAGLQVQDVIVGLGERTAPPGATLADLLLPHRPGAQVTLQVLRAGRRVPVPVRLGERPEGR